MKYAKALKVQQDLVQKVKSSREGNATNASNALVLVEHDPVYTTGLFIICISISFICLFV